MIQSIHDVIDAVITPESCNLLTIVRRVEAMGSFLSTDEGKNLLAGTKRAAQHSGGRGEEGTAVAPAVDPALFRERCERRSSTPR